MELEVSVWPGSQEHPCGSRLAAPAQLCIAEPPPPQSRPFTPIMRSDRICPFEDKYKTISHDLRERVENNLNNTVSPQGQLPRLDWTQLQVLEQHVITSLFFMMLMKQAQLLDHMAKRNLGKQMCILIKFKNPVKYSNYNGNSFTCLILTL